MTTADLDSLHAALDAHPADQDTRLVLADWYEEYGEMWMADGLRLMAEGVVSPRHGSIGWYWVRQPSEESFVYGNRLRPLDYDGIQAEELWDHEARTKSFPTRREAEEALCRALAKEGVVACLD